MNKFKSKTTNESQIPYILIGAALICLILFFVLFFPRNPKIEARLAAIEERLLNLEGGERILRIEDKLSRLEKSIPLRLDTLEKKLNHVPTIKADGTSGMKKDGTSETVSSSTQTSEIKTDTIKEKTAIGSKPKNISGTESAPSGSKYYEIRQGDNLYNLSRRYGISLDELRRLNHLEPGTILQPGQKILVNP